MLTTDTMVYERALYANGFRGVMQDPTKGPDKPRINGSSLSFENLLFSLTLPGANGGPAGPGSSGDKDRPLPSPQPPLVLPQYAPHNAGNDSVMCLFALQRLLEPAGTQVPSVKKVGKGSKAAVAAMMMGVPMVNVPMVSPMPMAVPMMGMGNMSMGLNVPGAMGVPFPQGTSKSLSRSRPTTVYDLAGEFGQMQMQHSAAATGAGASRVPNPGSYGYGSTSLRPPLGSGSKRMHSFPNPKTEALE